MTVLQAMEERRAYRVLDPVVIDRNTIEDLAHAAGLAPSCYNKHPWRFVFVQSPDVLEQLREAFSKGNEWCFAAGMVVAVCCRKQDDCVIGDRDYFLFDTGMATALLMLRATEMGLVAHPIAGYSPTKVREVLGIPAEYQVITLVNVGRHGVPAGDGSERDARLAAEAARPPRKTFAQFAAIDRFDIIEPQE